jgi:uncharacterized membrane protein
MKKTLLLVLLVLLSNSVLAATIRGSVYDLALEKVGDVVLKIDTIPEQTFVSKDGDYSFEVGRGEYTITVQQISNQRVVATASENVSVIGNGTFVVDLILFPDIDFDDFSDLNLSDVVAEPTGEGGGFGVAVIVIIIACAFAIALFVVARKRKHAMTTEPEVEDDQKVIDFIRKNKRVTQKQIRQEFPLSEAKVSLILTELEHKGKIEKIKKGRANIVIWKG